MMAFTIAHELSNGYGISNILGLWRCIVIGRGSEMKCLEVLEDKCFNWKFQILKVKQSVNWFREKQLTTQVILLLVIVCFA